MSTYIIQGGKKLEGEVSISGSKNAALPIIAASILNAGKTTLYNLPDIHDTQMMFEILKSIGGKVTKKHNKVIIDTSKVNYAIYNNIPSNVQKIEERNPSILFKSIKNEIELKNIRNSHIKDGVAFTKFMYWLKNNIGKIDITEISATQKLEDLRREQDKFIEPSFSTIAAYKDHAAMMHYSATEESNYKLEPRDLFLVDSGGQYFDVTTDITRTIAL